MTDEEKAKLPVIQAFWIDEVGYGDYVWHSDLNQVRILETNCPMNTSWGEMMEAKHYLDISNWKNREEISFWAKDDMLGPFRCRADAEMVATSIMMDKRIELKKEITELQKKLRTMHDWKLIHESHERKKS